MSPLVEKEGTNLFELAQGEHVFRLDKGETPVSVEVRSDYNARISAQERIEVLREGEGGVTIVRPNDLLRKDTWASFKTFTIRTGQGDEKTIYYIPPDIAEVLREKGVLQVKKPETEK